MYCQAELTTFPFEATSLRARFIRPTGLRLPGMNTMFIAIITLSVFDLFATLWCMKTAGMYEMNPIVHFLASSPHPYVAIAAFKALSVAGSVLPLHALRTRNSAKLAAWFMVAVLSVLAVRWVCYGATLAEVSPEAASALTAGDPDWIKL